MPRLQHVAASRDFQSYESPPNITSVRVHVGRADSQLKMFVCRFEGKS